jgi:transglutaminase-like putative cysteine protease
VIDEREVDWPRVARVFYEIRQRFRYDYPRPIRRLRHRLMVVPPDRHGDQRTVASHVTASLPAAAERRTDEHGNVYFEFAVPDVETAVEFDARIVVSRAPGGPASAAGVGRGTPTRLTAPSAALVQAASGLEATGLRGLALAEVVNGWVHRALTYERGATGVGTTAADALALGRGVCQDFAHVMLALCHLLGLPARYVSGHVLGEGGTHAWVEVLLPGGAGSGPVAHAFDPTYGARAGLGHVTVATGRDYRDVAPTSGTYDGAPGGRLEGSKRVDIVRVTYARDGLRTA